MPRVFPYANGLMTRSPIWRDSWIKRTEKWAFLCRQLEAARQNRIPPTWPSEANLLLSYEICWLCGLSRSDTAEVVDYGYSAEFRGYNNIEDQYVCLVAAFVGGRSSDVWTKRTISSWLFAGKQMKSGTWIGWWWSCHSSISVLIHSVSQSNEGSPHALHVYLDLGPCAAFFVSFPLQNQVLFYVVLNFVIYTSRHLCHDLITRRSSDCGINWK